MIPDNSFPTIVCRTPLLSSLSIDLATRPIDEIQVASLPPIRRTLDDGMG
jgi:hypothetical protein